MTGVGVAGEPVSSGPPIAITSTAGGWMTDGIDRDDDPAVDGTVDWRQVTERRYDPSRDGELTAAIVFAVADAEDVPASEVDVPPLYDVVDVAAIQRALFDHEPRARSGNVAGTVSFRYREKLVRVRSDSLIQVYEPSESQQS